MSSAKRSNVAAPAPDSDSGPDSDPDSSTTPVRHDRDDVYCRVCLRTDGAFEPLEHTDRPEMRYICPDCAEDQDGLE